MHAYAGADPVMHALSEMAAAEGGDGSCKRCHAPAQRRQDLLAGRIPGRSTDRLEEGISCDVCHSVSGVPPVASIDFLDAVDPYGPKYANLPDPIDTPAHASVKRNFYSSSTFCAPCHQIDLPSGDGIENTFGEWQSSLLSGMGVECQTCHMPEYRGRAATDGPVRDNLHRHEVVGVDYAYEAFRGIDLAAQRDAIRALLSASVSVTAELPASVSAGGDFEIAVTVVNDRTGHSIPSGVSFSREMWVEVTVREGGDAIYRSGWLKPNGDLVTLSEDPALTGFGSRMFDAAGAPTMFTWRATRIDDSGLLRFGDSRTGTYVVPVPAGTIGPLTADLALRFRPIKPAIIRAVDLERLLPIEIFDMWTESVRVEVAP
ncbi:MAG: cytochrome c family protein [Gemmatimonadota bacterium]|nr:MAG: cytochrome c family protein [Gemmatimonadota bacterium]